MVRQSKMFASMRKLYETKMAQMDKQMRMTVQQRDKLQAQIQNLGSNVVAEKKRLKEKLMSKLRNTEKQLDMLKRKQAEFEKLKRLQARAKQRVRVPLPLVCDAQRVDSVCRAHSPPSRVTLEPASCVPYRSCARSSKSCTT